MKVNDVIHGTFDDQAGYEYYMETGIMGKLRLKDTDNITSNIQGCITWMIINRKYVLEKLINKRIEKLH